MLLKGIEYFRCRCASFDAGSVFVGDSLRKKCFGSNKSVSVRFEFFIRWVSEIVRPTTFVKCKLNVRCPATVVGWVESGKLFERIFRGGSRRSARLGGVSLLFVVVDCHDVLWCEIGIVL